MSERVRSLSRQWIPMMGGSCDVRMGFDALEQASKLFAGSVGTPRLCVAVCGSGEDESLIERWRRQLVDAGFEVTFHMVGDAAGTLEEASRLFEALASAHATADDLCCAMGDAKLLSLAAYACSSWCGGMPLVAIPTSEVAFLEGVIVPRGLSVGGGEALVNVKAHARHALLDYDLMLSPLASEESSYARVIMVAAAMAGSERTFSELWDRADAIMSEDETQFAKQLMATAKGRGQAMASTAVATRQSVGYGQDVAGALSNLMERDVPRSVLVAEGMRFAARVSAAMGKLSIDDLLAQDELLDTFGIGSVSCKVEPTALVAALKEDRFKRTNRFMLLVPLSIGRVRLATVTDDMLYEHAVAWCEAHAR